MLKVLIVDDSQTVAIALRQALEKDPEILVAGVAESGDRAMQLIERFDPDLVTMDVYLRHENGLDVTARIMRESPRPILVVTAMAGSDPRLAFKAVANGALDISGKLPAPTHPSYAKERAQLIRTIKNLAQIPVMHGRRTAATAKARRTAPAPGRHVARDVRRSGAGQQPLPPGQQCLLIGASTGGPPIVMELLRNLDAPLPVPVVIVQHLAEGFGHGLASWLQQCTGHATKIVDQREELAPGVVLVAPDNQNIELVSPRHVTPTPADSSGPCPSIDRLFSSAARYRGGAATCVLLTGMGRDGAAGMRALADAGALTAAQAPETCAVDSMPRSAIESGAARLVLTPEELGALLRKQVEKTSF